MDTAPNTTISKPFRIMAIALTPVAILAALLAFMGRFDVQEPTVDWVEHDATVPLGGEVVFQLAVMDHTPGLASVVLHIDDGAPIEATPLPVGEVPTPWPATTHRFDVDTTQLTDGPHKISVDARDRSLFRNLGQAFELMIVDNTPPILQAAGDGVAATQGHTHALMVRSDEPLAELTASFLEREAALYPVGDEGLYRALVGFGVKEEPGSVDVALSGRDLAGNTAELSLQVQLEDVRWPSGGYIALSGTQTRAQGEKDKSAEANSKRGDAYAHEEPQQLWAGPFLRPAKGPSTSPFGKVRRYSTGAERHHLGVDIANTEGTPIVAPAAGVVTLAEELHIYGNAVILSHGQGISTSYNHLGEIQVEVGAQVTPGQVIGTMGSTGQSTGSHLHWGMVANGIAVNPMQWIDGGF